GDATPQLLLIARRRPSFPTRLLPLFVHGKSYTSIHYWYAVKSNRMSDEPGRAGLSRPVQRCGAKTDRATVIRRRWHATSIGRAAVRQQDEVGAVAAGFVRSAGDSEPAVCLGALYAAFDGQSGRGARGDSGVLLRADRAADLFVAFTGIPDRQVRSQTPAFRGRGVDRSELDCDGIRRFALGTVPDLRHDGRHRYRHHLRRRGRHDGAVVPGLPGICDRRGRGRLRLRRGGDDLADFPLAVLTGFRTNPDSVRL